MPTYSHGRASNQVRSAAQRIDSKNHRREVYWCVMHQLLERQRCGKLVNSNTSCVSNELIEEVHAYVMYKLAKKKRCEGTDAVEPDQCEQLISQLVESWHRKNHQPLEPMPRRSDSPSRPRTFKEIDKMITDEIIFGDCHTHCHSPVRSWQPNKTSKSTVGVLSNAKNRWWMPKIPSFFSGSKSVRVSPELHSEDESCNDAKLSWEGRQSLLFNEAPQD